MPQHTPALRVCRNCDGFATVAITTGRRHPDGTRETVPVACPTCKGTGHTIPVLVLSRVGR